MPDLEGTTVVDPEAILQAAQEGARHIERFQNYLDDAKRWIVILDSFWKGEAAEAYIARLESLIEALEINFEPFAATPEKLEEVAARYGDAEKLALNIAEGIEKPQWAAV